MSRRMRIDLPTKEPLRGKINGGMVIEEPIIIESNRLYDFSEPPGFWSPIIYIGKGSAVTTLNGAPVLRTTIKNLWLEYRGDGAGCPMSLFAFRSSRLENIRLSVHVPMRPRLALLDLVSGDIGFGCHYVHMNYVWLYCNNNVENGLRVESRGTHLCNANQFQQLHVSHAERGIQIKDGVGNCIDYGSIEKCDVGIRDTARETWIHPGFYFEQCRENISRV